MKDSILTNPPKTIHVEPAAKVDFAEFKKAVTSRRSVRVFTDEKIPEADVKECLELALLAPTSSNLQQWEFLWVRTTDTKEKLIEACFSQSAARTAAELIVCVARTGTWKDYRHQMMKLLSDTDAPKSARDYYQWIVPLVYTQGPLNLFGLLRSMLFWVVGWFRPVPREPSSKAGMRVWAVKSTALACENLMLALRAKGFDTCPMEGFDSRRVRRLFKIPRDAEIVMVIGAGRRADNGVYGPRLRFESKNFIREV